MPVQTGKSGLAAKYGGRLDSAVRAHANDETSYGPVPLPPGITTGIAKLIECKFDLYKIGDYKDEYYFRAAAVVVEPYSVLAEGREMVVAGLQTSVMIPCCDTKTQAGKITPQDEHIDRILNEMRKLAGDEFTHGKGGADLEVMAALLKKAGPFFNFTTTVRKSQDPKRPDGVWENWNGTKGLENYVPPAAGGVQDNTTAQEAAANPSQNGTGAEPFNEFAPGGGEATTADEEDLDALAAIATDDEAANARLTELAVGLGISEETVAGANSWEDVVTMIREAQGAGDGSEAQPEPEKPAEPEKGLIYGYEITNTKTKKKTVVQGEVVLVDKKSKIVTLKNTVDKKTLYKGVKWDLLLPPT